jgi:hypothetical protein
LKGFPWHPHRGIETITYVLQGDVQHGDSMGNRGVISSGDIQWMTAGNGVIHEEMPKGDASGVMDGFQLWANLPASHKMMGPRYRDIKSGQVPEIETREGARIRIICGRVGDTEGPVRDIVIEPQYLDVTVPAGATFSHATVRGHTVFAYVIDGNGLFCEESDPSAYDVRGVNYFDLKRDRFIANGTALLFSDGDSVTASAEKEQLRFLLVSGKPIREPIAWYGPIVMNNHDELRTAFDELDKGTFIKKPAG